MNKTLHAVVAMCALALTNRGAKAADVGSVRSPAELGVSVDTPSGRFADSGVLVVSSDAGLFISNTRQTGRSGSTTTTELRPAIDYFPLGPASVGGFLGLDYTSVPGGHTATFSVGPRLGYDVRISPRFSAWARVGVSFASTTETVSSQTRTQVVGGVTETTTIPGITTNSHNLAVNVFFPVLFHPIEHFFLGFGPALDADITGDVKATTLAARLTIGGWL